MKASPITLRSCLAELPDSSTDGPSPTLLEAQVLLAHLLGKTRAWVMAHPEAQLSDEQVEAWRDGLGRLEQGEPLAYLLGRWEFYGLDFSLTPAVLIPRPETELLVERALAWLVAHPGRRRALDVGTGSGCIAVTLAVHVPDLIITATDISPDCLQIAGMNAAAHGVTGRVGLLESDLLASPVLNPGYDLLCANLPYIPHHDLLNLEVYKYEPILALDGGLDGLVLIRRLLVQAPRFVNPDGLILLEIEARQGAAIQSMALATFPEAQVRLLKDLAGRDRVVEIEL